MCAEPAVCWPPGSHAGERQWIGPTQRRAQALAKALEQPLCAQFARGDALFSANGRAARFDAAGVPPLGLTVRAKKKKKKKERKQCSVVQLSADAQGVLALQLALWRADALARRVVRGAAWRSADAALLDHVSLADWCAPRSAQCGSGR